MKTQSTELDQEVSMPARIVAITRNHSGYPITSTSITVRALGGQINEALMELVRNDLESKVQITACVDAVMSGFTHDDEVTRVAALDWLLISQK